jgi:hypothetical protein
VGSIARRPQRGVGKIIYLSIKLYIAVFAVTEIVNFVRKIAGKIAVALAALVLNLTSDSGSAAGFEADQR